jgi:large subunit ribosomal protein L15
MNLNKLKPAVGAKKDKTRVGRGIGCGLGKTCGLGHKGGKARAGYSRRKGFEGGQTPMQRRLPKFGFTSLNQKRGLNGEVYLRDLAEFSGKVVDIDILKQANLIDAFVKKVKVVVAGKLEKSVTLKGIKVTAGARKAIEAVGGKIEE